MDLLETGIFGTAADRYLRGLYRNQCSALLRHQDSATGLWHTVLTEPASPLENSGSAGILYGMLRGIRTGVLETEIYLSAVEKGVHSLLNAVTHEGILEGVSYGTPVAMNQETYAAIPEHPMPYGQALAMMVFTELVDDFLRNV
jgi:unsaturated rhamnogalacturonyl hydrolase